MGCPILHIAVIDFHHKKGCQLEFCYPPINELNNDLPVEWQNLPSLAIPDGAHNLEQDVIYFLLPSLDLPNTSIFGISCYRQIAAKELLNKSSDVTRSTVQKSVCVLSKIPLFGVLTAKLQLITQVYFDERDFAKIEVLSQLYHNLCDIFTNDTVDSGVALMNISVRSVVSCFKHRILTLFKLFMLEKKIIFYISPVQKLGEIMLAIASLFPDLIEKGLFQAASYQICTSLTLDTTEFDNDKKNYKADDTKSNVEESEIVSSIEASNPAIDNEKETANAVMKPGEMSYHLASDIDGVEDLSNSLQEAASEVKDKTVLNNVASGSNLSHSYGFPLQIFTKGSLFHPYLSITDLEMIRSDSIRAYCIGATNTLFIQRRDLTDVIVTVSDSGEGEIDIINPDLRRSLSLTAADLRFIDFVIKNVEINYVTNAWEGGDEWIRSEMRTYLLSLMGSVHSNLKNVLVDFNENFINQWKLTNNYRIWESNHFADLTGIPPGHPFAGTISVSDVILRVEHSIGNAESARRVVSAVSTTGKYFSDTSARVKSNVSLWFRNNLATSNDT